MSLAEEHPQLHRDLNAYMKRDSRVDYAGIPMPVDPHQVLIYDHMLVDNIPAVYHTVNAALYGNAQDRFTRYSQGNAHARTQYDDTPTKTDLLDTLSHLPYSTTVTAMLSQFDENLFGVTREAIGTVRLEQGFNHLNGLIAQLTPTDRRSVLLASAEHEKSLLITQCVRLREEKQFEDDDPQMQPLLERLDSIIKVTEILTTSPLSSTP